MTDDLYEQARRQGIIRNGTWLDQQTFPRLSWAVPGIIPEGFGLLVAPPKAGKSWLSLDTSLAVSMGGVAFGRLAVGAPRPTLYLALEDGDRRLQERCRALLGAEPLPARWERITKVTPEHIVPIVRAWVLENSASRPLVLLDTLGKVMPPAFAGESTYQRDYRIGGVLKDMADSADGATILVVHHDRKAGSEDFVDSVSGTHGLAGSADFVLALDRKRNEQEAVLRVTGRDVREAEYGLVLATSGQWKLMGDSLAEAARAAVAVTATAGLGEDSSRVVRFIAEHPEGVSTGKVAAHMGWDDRKTSTYLGRLVKAERVTRLDRGLYSASPTSPVGSVGSVGSRPPLEPHTPNTPNRGGEG